MPDGGRNPLVFISHSHDDAALAQVVSDTFRARAFEVASAKDFLPGDDWPTKVAHALRSADVVVFVVTQHFLASPSIDTEVASAFALSLRKPNMRLVPVLHDVSPESLPPLLQSYSGVSYDDLISAQGSSLLDELRQTLLASTNDDSTDALTLAQSKRSAYQVLREGEEQRQAAILQELTRYEARSRRSRSRSLTLIVLVSIAFIVGLLTHFATSNGAGTSLATAISSLGALVAGLSAWVASREERR